MSKYKFQEKTKRITFSSIIKRSCYGRSHFVRHMSESSSNWFLGNADEVSWKYGISRVATNVHGSRHCRPEILQQM